MDVNDLEKLAESLETRQSKARMLTHYRFQPLRQSILVLAQTLIQLCLALILRRFSFSYLSVVRSHLASGHGPSFG